MRLEAQKQMTKLEREISVLRSKLNDLSNQLSYERGRIEDLEGQYEQRYLGPLGQEADEQAHIEALFDLLCAKKDDKGKPMATQEEIRAYLDRFSSYWSAMLQLMIDKKYITPKEYNCALITYHHMKRIVGLRVTIDQNEYFRERQKYWQILMEMEDPLSMIGR